MDYDPIMWEGDSSNCDVAQRQGGCSSTNTELLEDVAVSTVGARLKCARRSGRLPVVGGQGDACVRNPLPTCSVPSLSYGTG
ncbi:unnamed protein product [Danaus chrysippus]|uniref:(African queen) hypothetical protein n=1 Tax=Danaus chrysippus TaxID=151541 RepID=A0A8J2QHS5_9NEOP|nr:unnamed protein product [Danaus chrysippus]